jgi:hypothetical protein
MIYQSLIEVLACGSCYFNSISRVLLAILKSISSKIDSKGIGKNKVITPEFVICLIFGKQSTIWLPNGQINFVLLDASVLLTNIAFASFRGPTIISVGLG